MENYINVDQNMVVSTTIGDVPVEWHDVRKAPISIHGLHEPETEPFFYRLPLDVAAATSPGVDKLNRECAGGRVRFSTDSPYIAVRATYRAVGRSSHLTLVSTAGFDLYMDGEYGSRYVKEFRMPYDMVDRYEQIVHLEDEIFRSYTMNMPVHACVESLEIGLKPGARLEEARPYRNIKPVVIYGSSIVHGTAASRPGNIYPAVISRKLNVDVRNLGFSGKALGEKVFAEWMATMPMSVFVCDYDHNAPTPEHLQRTHERMFMAVRKAHPEIPIIIMTRPRKKLNEEEKARHQVIETTYRNALDRGDDNVYLIDGAMLTALCGGEGTIDGTHPTDFGFASMAAALCKVLRSCKL